MYKIMSSASKIVFILLAFTACIGFVLKLLPVDQFMLLCMGAFSYYFTLKNNDKTPPPSASADLSTS